MHLQRNAPDRSSHSLPHPGSHGALLTIQHAAEHKPCTKKLFNFLKATLVSDTLRL